MLLYRGKKIGTLYNLNWLHLKWKLYLQFLFWQTTAENKEWLIVLSHIFNSGEIPLTCFKLLFLYTKEYTLKLVYMIPTYFSSISKCLWFFYLMSNWICMYMVKFLSKVHICISFPSKQQFCWTCAHVGLVRNENGIWLQTSKSCSSDAISIISYSLCKIQKYSCAFTAWIIDQKFGTQTHHKSIAVITISICFTFFMITLWFKKLSYATRITHIRISHTVYEDTLD